MEQISLDKPQNLSDQINQPIVQSFSSWSDGDKSNSDNGFSDFSDEIRVTRVDNLVSAKGNKSRKTAVREKGRKDSGKPSNQEGQKHTEQIPTPNTKPMLSHQLGEDMTQCLISPKPKRDDTLNLLTLMTLTNPGSTKAVDAGKALNDLLLDGFQHSSQNFAATVATQLVMAQLMTASGSFPMVQGISGVSLPGQHAKIADAKNGNRPNINTFTLSDFTALSSLETLVERFGRVSHMGILDPSYSFFLNKSRDAALYYKVQNQTAVVGGDPLCRPDQFKDLLEEFRRFRRRQSLGIVFLGATDSFVHYAKMQKRWVTMRFGSERVINPLTNTVLQETESKRMLKQNKMLVDWERGRIGVRAYSPTQGNSSCKDVVLETQLANVYHSWREQRNQTGQPQTYMTVFDPFAIPSLMVYVYTIDLRAPEKGPNGFAALRKLGANKGYHLDPCCVTPDAPRGITDLLVFSAMSLLKKAGIAYMSLGFEPATDLGEINAMSRPLMSVTRSVYRRIFRSLAVSGKKAFHDKYRPDETLESGLHLVFPDGIPGSNEMLACMHIANISAKQLCSKSLKRRLNMGNKTPEKKSTETDQKGINSKMAVSSSSSDSNGGSVDGCDDKVPSVTVSSVTSEANSSIKSKKRKDKKEVSVA